jgi:hypothetical protein
MSNSRTESGGLRKHLYLVTEHETDEYVGDVMLTDKKRITPEKNQEAPHTVRRDGEFVDIGQIVCIGQADFEDEDDLKERFPEVAKQKLREVDPKWLEKAGVDVEGVTA